MRIQQDRIKEKSIGAIYVHRLPRQRVLNRKNINKLFIFRKTFSFRRSSYLYLYDVVWKIKCSVDLSRHSIIYVFNFTSDFLNDSWCSVFSDILDSPSDESQHKNHGCGLSPDRTPVIKFVLISDQILRVRVILKQDGVFRVCLLLVSRILGALRVYPW